MSVLAWERPLKPVQTTMFSRSVVLVLATVGLVSTASAQCLCYSIRTIPGPNCPFVGSTSFAFGMNGDGELCGGYTPCSKGLNGASVWLRHGNWITLPTPAGLTWYSLNDLNSARQVAGTASPTSTSGGFRAARYDLASSTFIELVGPPKYGNSEASAINESGWVCGYTSTPKLQAFLWKDSQLNLLDMPLGPYSVANDISDSGSICGWMGEAPLTSHAFLWHEGVVTDLGVIAGGQSAQARGISKNGRYVCGGGVLPMGEGGPLTIHAFLWSEGTMTDLGTLPSQPRSLAYAVNDSGIVVGASYNEDLVGHAFVGRNGVMYRLSDLVYPPQPTLTIRQATAINNAGQIAGQAGIPGGNAAIRLTPIPPTSGDCNCDQRVNVNDLLNVIYAWNTPGTPNAQGGSADLNQDKTVNVDDLWIVLNNWAP